MMKKFIHPLLFSLCVGLPTACVTHKEESGEEPELEESSADASEPREVEPGEIDASVDSEITDASSENVPEIGSEEDEINQVLKSGLPIEINEKVEQWIHFFSKKNPEAFQRFMDRGEPYKKMIVATLRDHGIPSEVYYLAMIESGFMLHAKSPMSAVGFWQFIPGTGRRYGLRVDRYVDERRDPWRSSVAASMYLSDLNNVFDSWYLALAAYNAGEMRIMNAIMRGKSRDFWALARNRMLPSETMDYIPKFLAAFIIGSNPEKYGFRRPIAEPHEAVSLVSIPSPMALSKVSEVTGVPLERLQQFNPHLKTGITPPDTNTYKIWVPHQDKAAFAGVDEKLTPFRLSIRQARETPVATNDRISSKPATAQFHRVRRGENLNVIAQKYDMSVAELMRINRLKSSRLFIGRKLRVQADPEAVATTGSEPQASKANRKSRVSETQRTSRAEARKVAALAALKNQPAEDDVNADKETYYRVKRGDNLHTIARRFQTTIHDLKKINNLRRSDLQIGQLLLINRNES